MNYKEYVGREDEFDFSAASQFCLLFHAGLRESHTVLDFGCGCLRLGRLLIPFLQPGKYHGYDPNDNLYEEFINEEYSPELIRRKKAVLSKEMSPMTGPFDFIIAHSIFTHTGVDLFHKYMKMLCCKLKTDGDMLATFYVSKKKSNKKNGWIYKDCYAYSNGFIESVAKENNVFAREIKWWHPRQKWFWISKTEKTIPDCKGMPTKNISELLTFNHNEKIPEKYTRSQ